VLPSHWEEAIAACLAKDPAARPQTAAELKERILSPARVSVPAATRARAPVSSTPASAETKTSWIRQHPLAAAFAIGAIPFLVLGIVWFVDLPRPRKESKAIEPQPTPAPSIVPYSPPPTSSPIASTTPSSPVPTAAPSVTAPVYVPPPSSTAPAYVPPPLPRTTPSTTAAEQIRQFVAEHLRKMERCDCDGVLSDYASSVDYFDNGVVSKDFIARDCSAYVKAWPQITLQLTGMIDVRESGASVHTVSFGYDFDARNKAKGKTSRGHSANTWRVQNSLGEFRITYHRETVTKR
jgi:hypothetical protein